MTQELVGKLLVGGLGVVGIILVERLGVHLSRDNLSRDFPGNLESTNRSRDNLSREIGRIRCGGFARSRDP